MDDVDLDKAELIAIFLESLIFGMFAILYVITMWLLLRKRRQENTGLSMIIIVSAMMVLSIVHLGLDLLRIMQAFIANRNVQDGAIAYYENVADPTEATKTVIYVTNTALGDGFVTYRTWVVWGHNWWIILVPILLVFGTATAGYGVAAEMLRTHGGDIFASGLQPWITAFISLTFTTNVLCTIMIAGRLYYRQRSIGQHVHSNTSLWPVMQLVIESGSLLSAALLSLLLSYVFGSNGQYPALDAINPLIGVTFSLILVRVGLGVKGGLTTHSEPHFPSRNVPERQYPMKPLSINVSRLVERDGYPEMDHDESKISSGSDGTGAFKAV